MSVTMSYLRPGLSPYHWVPHTNGPFTQVSPQPPMAVPAFQAIPAAPIPALPPLPVLPPPMPVYSAQPGFLPPPPPLPTGPATVVAPSPLVHKPFKNRLKSLFHHNKAVTYALHLRTFGAEDKNGDGQISFNLGESGTFLSAIKKLDELKAMGINNIHLLPLNPAGKIKRLGEAGSVYAPEDYHRLNPEYDTPGNGLNVIQEARIFIQEAHKRGIHVMADIPSCASIDLAQKRPDLLAYDKDGKMLTPTNWIDIVMFEQDSPELRDYYQGFFDLMIDQLGVDGFRVDVARARTPEFWKHFIDKYPDKAWLAESYVEEDASPLKNIPRDIPEALLKAGFDSFYGQFHIFHSMANASEYNKYLLDTKNLLNRAGQGKSVIGSFLTHDDPPLMKRGGVTMSLLSAGLMACQPWTNPYILDGFTTGYKKHFDIFKYADRPTGDHPEIGSFTQRMMDIRKQYHPVFSEGLYIPIPVTTDPSDQIIAFARHYNGKTLLVIANKDINARHTGKLSIPGLPTGQPLQNIAPAYGQPSHVKATRDGLKVDLGPGRFHLLEINTPDLPLKLPSYQ